jgi:hypothetical protein
MDSQGITTELEKEIRAFELWQKTCSYLSKLWREHAVSDFPKMWDPELF